MTRPCSRPFRQAAARWAGPVATGLVYLAAAAASIALTTGANGIAVVWPSSGVLLAALLLAPRAAWGRYVAAAALASLIANMGGGLPATISGGFTAANMTESVLAAWLARRGGGRPSFVRLDGLGRFCLAAVVASAASAALATAVVPTPSAAFAMSWLATGLLGMLVIAPTLLIFAELRPRRPAMADAQRVLEAIALLGLVAATAMAVFLQSRYPLLFLPFLPLLAAVVRLGPFGAAASVWIVATVGSVATAWGRGPIHLIDGTPAAQALFLQLYVLAAFASALPIAALLAARDRLTATLAERNRLLLMAESVAQVGHWRLDAATGAMFWSQEVFRIHGLSPDDPPTVVGAIEAYHPEDRPIVALAMQRALDEGEPFELTARLLQPNGEARHVLARGEADRDRDGRVVGVFGVFQDVSLQVATRAAMDRARQMAEAAARHATQLAETDPLTGLANRRKALCGLDEAIADARFDGAAVSVVMFDIDHFKRVNDTLGHAAGDEVLRRVARAASDVVRAGDVVGRLGGEEFVLVLPHADGARAAEVAERVRASIEAGGQAGGDARGGPAVSASFGVATFDGEETAETLLGRADRALYDAKRAGRNTLRHADPHAA